MPNSPPPISIKLAGLEHADFVWLLYRELMKPIIEEVMQWHDINQRRVIEENIGSANSSLILLAENPIGWFYLRTETHSLRLCQIHIGSHFQRLGIGTQIIKCAMSRARANRVPLLLEVMKNNCAHILYRRLGFSVSAESNYKFHMIWSGVD